MGKAFLVVGAEATGTRLATRILINAGCSGSDEHFDQPFDSGVFRGEPLAVWRRSIPHSHEWPDIPELIRRLNEYGYEVTALVTMREWLATSKATRRNHPADTPAEALERLMKAYRWIFKALIETNVPYDFVHYESLILHPEATQRALLHRLGLDDSNMVEIYDGNKKHYGLL